MNSFPRQPPEPVADPSSGQQTPAPDQGTPQGHDPKQRQGRRKRRQLSAEEINPYTRYVHDYPAILLAEPTPQALGKRLAAASGGPIVLDLGCGSGNFLLELAGHHPDHRFVGFELRYKRLVKGARKVERRGLHNVLLLRDRAEHFPSYFGKESISRVHVNFPDPWPKSGERGKRLVNEAFLDALEPVLSPGGCFCLKTDHSGYFLHVLSLLEGRKDWRLRTFRNDIMRRPLTRFLPRSEFEQLFRSKGKSIHYLELEKTGLNR